MTSEQKGAQSAADGSRPRDLLSRLYREIGISAVAAALEASVRADHREQKSGQTRKDISSVPRNNEAA
ncbi:MAG: hypothetical protein J2P49_05590 [Methylocapsa sp.]|nr:hypothetical protein [Methylocapsa sp.]